jgi:hypothetical protein
MRNVVKVSSVTVIVVIILMLLLTVLFSRSIYGVCNPYSTPKRVKCYDRTYNISNDPKIIPMAEDKKPKYKVPQSLLDKLSGKELYMSQPKGEFVPTVLYLHIDEDKYYTMELSGGS